MAVQLGASRHTSHGDVVSAADWIADRIAARYGNPSRRAYLYLFRVRPGADFMPIPPDPTEVVSAWIDEGGGLSQTSAAAAVERCQAQWSQLRAVDNPQTLGVPTHVLMARLVVFSVAVVDDQPALLMRVELFSRALAFTPKAADRRVTEIWRADKATDTWYSTYTGSRN